MASSFGATNIRIELDPNTGSAPTWERQSYVATRHIPGGNTDVTQVLGYGYQTIQLRLYLSSSEWTALQGQLLTSATLTMAGASQGTCLLESLGGATKLVNGSVTVNAAFRKAS